MSEQFVGRDVVVNFAIGLESVDPDSLTFKRLGMMRTKSMRTTWDTVDTTADMSPSFTKTNLVTFKMVEFSGDGVSYGEDLANQKEFKAHVISPGAGTGNQPKVWLEMIDPDGDKYRGPFIVNEWSDDRPYADVATWSTSAMSNGAVAFTTA
jgi:predicted secreted protein